MMSHTPNPYDVILPHVIAINNTSRPDNDKSYPHPYDDITPTSLLFIVQVQVGQILMLNSHHPYEVIPTPTSSL